MSPPYNAIDAHTHLDFAAFDGDRADVMARARGMGVRGVVICGADPRDWDRVQQVAGEIGAARCLGVHPWFIPPEPEGLEALLDDLANRADLDGIGEIGLDWYRARQEGPARAAQRAAFGLQLELAHERGLPVVVHLVRAHREGLGLLAARDVPAAGGMIHAWSGPPELVGTALDLGLHLSFGASLERSATCQESLRLVPDDRLLLETDCPDQPLGGVERGEPVHLIDVARLAADVRGTTVAALLDRCAVNAQALFPRFTPDDAA